MKKILVATILIMFVISLVGCDAFDAFKTAEQMPSFELNEDGKTYSVVFVGGELMHSGTREDEIIIPATYNGLPVTTIATDAISGYYISNVIISEGITSIEERGFNGCNSLTSVTIPGTVTKIDNLAFLLCELLTSITYNGTVEEWNSIAPGFTMENVIIYCTDGEIRFEP